MKDTRIKDWLESDLKSVTFRLRKVNESLKLTGKKALCEHDKRVFRIKKARLEAEKKRLTARLGIMG